MRRREFIAGLGGAVALPLAARAQQPERMRRIGVLMGFDENDPVAKTYVSAFTQALADLGWIDGRNVRMDFRSAGGDTNRIRAFAQELVGLQPDIIVTNSTPSTAALQQETRTIPIVFGIVADPVKPTDHSVHRRSHSHSRSYRLVPCRLRCYIGAESDRDEVCRRCGVLRPISLYFGI